MYRKMPLSSACAATGDLGRHPFNEETIPVCDNVRVAEGLQQEDLVLLFAENAIACTCTGKPLDVPNPDQMLLMRIQKRNVHCAVSWSCSFNAARDMHLATKVCPLALGEQVA